MFNKFIIAALLINLFIVRSNAQDSHYWTQKYGTQSNLLGGAVVGSHLDISSTFYNPGSLGITKNPAFVITGWVFNLTSITFESAAGQNNDIGSIHFSPEPDYFTGFFPTKSKNKIAYTFLTRYKFQERLFTRDSFRKDVLYRSGDELFSGDYYVDQDVLENWVGLTWSRGVSDKIGVGVTNFIAYRSQKFRSHIQNQAFTDDKNAAQSTETHHYNYFNYRALWKIGLAADFSPLRLGLAITTPSINIFGTGSSYISKSMTGLTIPGYNGQDFIEFNDQSNLQSNYTSPLSVAIGCSYTFHTTTIHMSSEWFHATAKNRVLSTNSFTSQSTGEKINNNVFQNLKSVINFGCGVQQVRSEKLEIYASFVTDFSAMSGNSTDNISITTWDIYHCMVGALFRLWRSEITAGIGFSFGQNKVQQKVDFDSAHEDNLLFGERGEKNGVYRNLTLLAGFSIFPEELLEKTLKGLPFFNHKKE